MVLDGPQDIWQSREHFGESCVLKPMGSLKPAPSPCGGEQSRRSDTNLAPIEYDRFRTVCSASWLIFLSSQRTK